MTYKNIAVIGAGIVGMAVAIELKKVFPFVNVFVFEKNKCPFLETSLYNSGVIHGGIHEKKGSLKAELSRIGVSLLLDFCRKNNVPHKKSGMLIAVVLKDVFNLISEIKSLWLLYKNSHQQKIPVRFLTKSSIRKIEPFVKASFGIFLSNIWVVNQKILGEKMVDVAIKSGINIISNFNAIAINRLNNAYELISDKNNRRMADLVVNAAGSRADEISALAGFKGYKVSFCRGEYYEIVGLKKDLIRSVLIYPAIKPGSNIKGIHLTKTIDGRLLIGPNAKEWFSRDDDFNIQTQKEEFFSIIRKFLPELELSDLKWAYSGLRSRISAGGSIGDFFIRKESSNPMFINLIGIESPGFTAAFGIAKYVANLAK